MSPPQPSNPRHRHRHRDAGLRRVATGTRVFAAASVALVGAFSALAAHAQAGTKSTVLRRTPATAPAASSGSPSVGTLPPDTFPPNAGTTPPTAAVVPQTQTQSVPQTTPETVPQVVSGSS